MHWRGYSICLYLKLFFQMAGRLLISFQSFNLVIEVISEIIVIFHCWVLLGNVWKNLFSNISIFFFNLFKIITNHQSGFRSKDSTVYQLLCLASEFYKALDMEKDIRIVFCDISKAFDKVWHKVLLFRLRKTGINSNLLLWFESYLSNR